MEAMTAAALLTPRRRLFTVEEYERMGTAGVFAEGDRVELLDGEIVEMSPIGPPHAGIVNRLNRMLIQRLGDRVVVAVQNPLRIVPRSEPQPDFVVAAARDDDYQLSHPEPADVRLVIEVADSSLPVDRGIKTSIYARAGVPEYWIVDVAGRALVVHRLPERGVFRDVVTLTEADRVGLAAYPDVVLDVGEVLGRNAGNP